MEWAIAASRVALATGGLLAIYWDPDQPSQGTTGYTFLSAYVLFSLVVLSSVYLQVAHRWRLMAHGLEIALVCLVIAYTEGPSSPFFVYFTFLLLSATIRWQGRGALITGTVLSIVLIALSTSTLLVQFDKSDFDRLVVRNIYLLVVSGLFAFLGEQLRLNELRQERLRLAHEIHDGLLQTLTAAKLKLHVIAARMALDERQQLSEVAHWLSQEQQRIRRFVDTARSVATSSPQTESAVGASKLDGCIARLKGMWGSDIELRVEPPDAAALPQAISNELELILAETVANAVNHGHATQIAVKLRKDIDTLRLEIKDNGCGLKNATGTYDHARLAAANIGPRSLRERIERLNGKLFLTSSPAGLLLQIDLPVQ